MQSRIILDTNRLSILLFNFFHFMFLPFGSWALFQDYCLETKEKAIDQPVFNFLWSICGILVQCIGYRSLELHLADWPSVYRHSWSICNHCSCELLSICRRLWSVEQRNEIEKDMWMWIKNRSRGTNRRSVILFVISFVITIVVRRQIRAYDWMQRLSRSRDAFERIHCLIHIILRFVKLIDRLH